SYSSLASIIIDSLLTDTSFHLSLLCSPTPNFWRVGIGSPALGMTVWSKVWHFQWTYVDSALVLPDDHGGTTLTPKFKWRRTSCTSSYEYQLATDSLFAQMVFDSTLSDTAYQRGSLDSAQTYFWRVGIALPSASKLWTQPRKFTAAWKYLGLNGELIQDIDIDWS